MLTAIQERSEGFLRHGPADALLVLLALGQGALVLAVPTLPVLALGLWWNSNTIAHYFLHVPFFRDRRLNTLFALYQTVLLGVPQSLWRDRHLAHHAGVEPRLRWSRRLVVEVALVLGLWAVLLARAPGFFLTVYVPGYLLGLLLCGLHGHYEHVGGGTTSHYGRLYNWLFFNDGYHGEHHASPGSHWTTLPRRATAGGAVSRWPACLRWLDLFRVEALERLVLRSPWLQRFVVRRHERALRALLPRLPAVRRAAVVGGGLFPRTVLVLQRLLPGAQLVVIDARAEHLDIARPFLSGPVELLQDWYDPARHRGFDLVVIPLAYIGDRAALYREPPAPAVLVHDWLWRRRGTGRVVSWLLLKRLNLVRP
jgi:hypothetical protein